MLSARFGQCDCHQSVSSGVQVNFEQDSVVSQANEYEVLQLLLADMRDRLTAYPGVPQNEYKIGQKSCCTLTGHTYSLPVRNMLIHRCAKLC